MLYLNEVLDVGKEKSFAATPLLVSLCILLRLPLFEVSLIEIVTDMLLPH